MLIEKHFFGVARFSKIFYCSFNHLFRQADEILYAGFVILLHLIFNTFNKSICRSSTQGINYDIIFPGGCCIKKIEFRNLIYPYLISCSHPAHDSNILRIVYCAMQNIVRVASEMVKPGVVLYLFYWGESSTFIPNYT